uniref:Plastid lipid-associated protein/fibrillin conserved domain-containing protein n=1 Tax=Lotharella oceanica TaxID=641309 RepID=A0A7S2XFV2_9EUKA
MTTCPNGLASLVLLAAPLLAAPPATHQRPYKGSGSPHFGSRMRVRAAEGWFARLMQGNTVKSKERAEQFKNELVSAMKLRQGPGNRKRVEKGIDDLVRNTEGQKSCRQVVKDGVWKLLWSSPSSSSNPFSTPDRILGGLTYQIIKSPRAANVVWWGGQKDKSAPQLFGGASIAKVGQDRTQLTVDSFALRIPGFPEVTLFNVTKQLALKVKDKPGGGERELSRNTDVLRTLYNDGALRISVGEENKIIYVHTVDQAPPPGVVAVTAEL